MLLGVYRPEAPGLQAAPAASWTQSRLVKLTLQALNLQLLLPELCFCHQQTLLQ